MNKKKFLCLLISLTWTILVDARNLQIQIKWSTVLYSEWTFGWNQRRGTESRGEGEIICNYVIIFNRIEPAFDTISGLENF